MRTITLEEHFSSPAFMEGPGKKLKFRAGQAPAFARVVERLGEVGDARIAEMDAAGIDVQVLSLTSPGTEQLDAAEALALAREANDFVAEAIAKHPGRLAAFAALPTAAPDKAAEELQRMVGRNFKGAVINGHSRGRYLDDPAFTPILACAEALDVPIYLHPTQPPQPVIDASFGGFSPLLGELLAGPGWGWHVETAVHVIRMILGGVFDRHPRLQIVIGHLGETLPFMMRRLDLMQAAAGLKRPLSATLRENVHYTVSGFNYPAVFQLLLAEVGVDRIMFSADHPYASMERAREFLDHLPISDEDREKIAHANAGRLLRI